MAKDPITPDQILSKKKEVIPGIVIDVFNELIARNFSDGISEVLQEDVITKLISSGLTMQRINDEKLLDIEEIYRKAGWKVRYDKPGYNESYKPYFIFEKKSG